MKEESEDSQAGEAANQARKSNDDRVPCGGTAMTDVEPNPKRQKFDDGDGQEEEVKQEGEGEEDGPNETIIADEGENPIWMSVWVWEAVLKFITRMEMANRVSLTCVSLKKLCWPRLHGDKVAPHVAEALCFDEAKEKNGQPKARLTIWKNKAYKEIPIVTAAPAPEYIQGFVIIIRYLNSEVCQFIRTIRSRFANNNLYLRLRSTFNFREFLDLLNGCPISFLHLSPATTHLVELRQCFPGLLEGIPAINVMLMYKESCAGLDGLIFAKMKSGKLFVFKIAYFGDHQSMPIGTIQTIFQSAIQPQSFMITFQFGFSHTALPDFRLENEATREVLALEHDGYTGRPVYELYRCPSGEVEQWRGTAKKLLKEENYTCRVTLN